MSNEITYERTISMLQKIMGEAVSRAEGSTLYDPKRQIDVRKNTILNSIKNNYDRWIESGMEEDFVTFMAERGGPWGTGWAAVGAPNDPNNLNENWIPNVKSIIASQLNDEEKQEWIDRGFLEPLPRSN